MVKHQLGNYPCRYIAGFSSRTIIFNSIYIYDLTNNLKSNVKLFTDDTSLFSDICDPLETASILTNNLRKNRKWGER